MFIASLLKVGKTWKQYKCPLTDEWIKKIWCIHPHIYIYIYIYIYIINAYILYKYIYKCVLVGQVK